METGTPFGHYRLLRVLGEGGMGRVYEAFDTRSDRVVALKVLPSHSASDPQFRERFRRESRAAAGLNDPHVIPIHQYGEIEGRLYLDMRLVQGVSVDAVLAQGGPMSPAAAVSVVSQVASALTAAHAQGLVHRDVKPSNMLLCADAFVYLIDFGLARTAGQAGLTGSGAAIGTFAYMSPERLAGVADARSDVYALTCSLYECLTATKPFPGTSLEHQITAHLVNNPPRPSQVRPEVPAAFDEVIARGMEKNPDKRYQTAAELAEAARQALAEPVAVASVDMPQPAEQQVAQAVPAPPAALVMTEKSEIPTPAGKKPRRGRALLILSVALAVLATTSWFATRSEQSSSAATTPTTASPTLPEAPSFTVGNNPEDVVLDPSTHTAYVGNNDVGSIWVVDTVSHTVTATVQVGRSALSAMVLDPQTHTLYTSGVGSISVVDTKSRSVTATITVGHSALQGIALDPAAHALYASDGLSIAVIDTVSRAVTASFAVGRYARQMEVDPVTHTIYAINYHDGSVSEIDAASGSVTATIKVGNNPKRLVLDPALRTAYVANYDDGTVSVIDTASHTVTATVGLGRTPIGAMGVALDPGTHTVYATNVTEGTVSIIDGTSHLVTSTVTVGESPLDVAVDPSTHTAYVVDNRSGSLSVIDR
ncbi:serine/threonine-protein kinase [Nocardia sp. CDC153]|uniref:serine/threonine-protein kinase n=1 Tax=Nocardia sp. CDC153 TaxID=3112167 RepID=UPI002DBD4E19|nr:serine/threonine-protein kinase [Nocardia sp. CDC153]MEC3952628.1 serine/threonine-protein kinase [Nocardia sp. CDC153]